MFGESFVWLWVGSRIRKCRLEAASTGFLTIWQRTVFPSMTLARFPAGTYPKTPRLITGCLPGVLFVRWAPRGVRPFCGKRGQSSLISNPGKSSRAPAQIGLNHGFVVGDLLGCTITDLYTEIKGNNPLHQFHQFSKLVLNDDNG